MRPLKVHFSNCNFSSSNGPHAFAKRLAVQMSNDGYQLADVDDYDVALALIEPGKGLDMTKPVVQRLDGIWFHPKDFYYKNQRIKALYEKADHVVFQSEFDKKMIEKWWDAPKAATVIHNGISLEHMSPLEGIDNLRHGSLRKYSGLKPYDKVFVCAANWHAQKRLADNIRLFQHIRSVHRSALIVLGSAPDVSVADHDVFYAGSQSHETCLQVYAACDWMIHLAYLDHCPNVVVEALSQGLPVICTDSGGTREIVRDNGIVLRDSPYGFELTDYDKPPPVDITQLDLSVFDMPNYNVDAQYLDIRTVASQYEAIFESLVP